jgi:hypothetical protein
MILDLFKTDAFGLVSLLQAVEKVERVPNRLGQLALFTPNPVRTETVAIEMREGALSIIKTSERGAPLENRKTEGRTVRDFRTRRIAKGDRIMASELAFAREFNTEQQVVELQAEMLRRMSGPSGLVADIETTWEHMRLGAVQGKVLDADGTLIYDWFKEFGISQSAEIDFDLDAASPVSGALRKKIQDSVVRPMRKKAKGAIYTGARALCGSNFFDDLVNHSEVRETYLNQQEAADLREGYDGRELRFGGVTWEEYIGTDDDSIAVHTDKVVFFPEGAGNGVFEAAFSPGEQFGHIGQLGQPIYPITVPDRDRDSYVDLEVYSYPLFLCKRPEMLFRGKRT